MQFVYSISSPGVPRDQGLSLQAVATVRAPKPVQSRTLPPLVVQHPSNPETPVQAAQLSGAGGVQYERRAQCRRVSNNDKSKPLEELRSSKDRRKNPYGEATDHIDELA
jgi:hypothetical protein